MSPVIRISDDLYRRLEILAEGFDTPSNVIEKLLNEKGVNLPNSSLVEDETPSEQPDLPASVFQKMHRIEGWAKKNKQPDVGRVVQTYLDLTKENEGIFIEIFISELIKRKVYKGEKSKIKNNLSGMKKDDGKQHAKIFYDLGNKIVMYDAVYIEVLKFFNRKK